MPCKIPGGTSGLAAFNTDCSQNVIETFARRVYPVKHYALSSRPGCNGRMLFQKPTEDQRITNAYSLSDTQIKLGYIILMYRHTTLAWSG
jgi:hypothetical protein